MEADLCVDCKCEIDRGRAFWQLDDIACRREHKDLVLIQIELEELQELIGRLGVHLKLEDLPKPREVAIELVSASLFALVSPVRRDAIVRGTMHLACADLDLEELSTRTEHGCVQRLISVRLRLRDVVLDALLKRCE